MWIFAKNVLETTRMTMSRNKNQKKTTNKQPYKGPYPHNPNLAFDQVRKNMATPIDGPTADAMSYSDSTIDAYDQNNSKKIIPKRRPTRKKTKLRNWWEDNWKNAIFGVLTSLFIGAISTIVNHSIHFVAIDKDIEFIKDNATKADGKIDKIEEDVINIDKNVELLDQKVDFQNNQSRK